SLSDPIAVVPELVALLIAPTAVLLVPLAVLTVPVAVLNSPVASALIPHCVELLPLPDWHWAVVLGAAKAGAGIAVDITSASGAAVISSFETKVLCMTLSLKSALPRPPFLGQLTEGWPKLAIARSSEARCSRSGR